MRIRIDPTLYIYLFTMAIFSSWKTCAGAASALFIHELGHLAVCRIVGDKIAMLELTPFGGVMTYETGKSPSKGIQGVCIALAGPAANYLFLMTAACMAEWLDEELVRSILSSNAAMLCVNLLPALPLDGGRIAFCLGYYIFSVFRLITVLSWMGIAAGMGFVFLALYGVVLLGSLNCSVLIVGFYLVYSAWKGRSQLLMENLYTVMQEKNENQGVIRPIKIYSVPHDMPLIRLVPYFGNYHICEFVYMEGKKEKRITERMIYQPMLERPLAAIEDIFTVHEEIS